MAVADDRDLVERLQAGDEAAFVELVRTYQTAPAATGGERRLEPLRRRRGRPGHLARGRARRRALRRAVHVQDVAVPHPPQPGTERRRTRASRAAPRRTRICGERFDANGAWATPPVPWAEEAEDRLVAQHLADRVRELLPELPEAQRQVLLLRDIEGVPAPDVCELLGVSDGNQRVLLHRARVHLRQTARPGDALMRLRFWRRRRALVCREAVALMAAYLDDALPKSDRTRLEGAPRGLVRTAASTSRNCASSSTSRGRSRPRTSTTRRSTSSSTSTAAGAPADLEISRNAPSRTRTVPPTDPCEGGTS